MRQLRKYLYEYYATFYHFQMPLPIHKQLGQKEWKIVNVIFDGRRSRRTFLDLQCPVLQEILLIIRPIQVNI